MPVIDHADEPGVACEGPPQVSHRAPVRDPVADGSSGTLGLRLAGGMSHSADGSLTGLCPVEEADRSAAGDCASLWRTVAPMCFQSVVADDDASLADKGP